MPIPVSYSEDELAAFMLAELGDVGADLGLSTAEDDVKGPLGDFTEPVNDVLLDYGTDDIASIEGTTNIKTLRAIGAVHAWRLAQKRAAARYDMTDGTQRLNRGQVFAAIQKQLQQAERIAGALGATSTASRLVVKVGRMQYAEDPYQPIDESTDAVLTP